MVVSTGLDPTMVLYDLKRRVSFSLFAFSLSSVLWSILSEERNLSISMSSITYHHSYQRAVTTHDTLFGTGKCVRGLLKETLSRPTLSPQLLACCDNPRHSLRDWEVRDNVAFNVKGHTYFVEDGN